MSRIHPSTTSALLEQDLQYAVPELSIKFSKKVMHLFMWLYLRIKGIYFRIKVFGHTQTEEISKDSDSSQVEQWYFQQWLGISKDLISRNLDISYIVSSGEQTDQIDSNAACKVLYLISLGRCLRKKWQLAQHLPLMCCELVAPFLPNEKFRARPNARTMRPNARTMMCWSCISEDWWGFCGISTYSKWWKITFCHICYILSNSIS